MLKKKTERKKRKEKHPHWKVTAGKQYGESLPGAKKQNKKKVKKQSHYFFRFVHLSKLEIINK